MNAAIRKLGTRSRRRRPSLSRRSKNRETIGNVTQVPMSDWIEALRANAIISFADYARMLTSDLHKAERLAEFIRICPTLAVPRIRVVNHASRRAFREALDDFPGERLNIRIVDNRNKTRRRHGLTKIQAKKYFDVAYVREQKYEVTLTEFIEPIISGTIISRGDALIAEIVHGPHYHLTQQSARPKHHGFFVDGRMTYDTAEADLREVIWRAVWAIHVGDKHYSPHVPPLFQTGYFEFLVNSRQRTIFTDFSRLGLFANFS